MIDVAVGDCGGPAASALSGLDGEELRGGTGPGGEAIGRLLTAPGQSSRQASQRTQRPWSMLQAPSLL